MPIGRWMDKEVVVHIHNGILLSCKMECIWVSSNEVDETKEKQKEVNWDNPEGQGGEEGGRGVQNAGDTCVPVADSCWCMAKKKKKKKSQYWW